MTKIVNDTQNSANKELTYSIYSNLTLLNDEIIEFIKSNIIQIHTSLDGLKNENDRVRGKGSYETLVSTIKHLQKNEITLSSITTTLKNENIQEVSNAFISELKE